MEITNYFYADEHNKHLKNDNTLNLQLNRCGCLDYEVENGKFIYDENIEFKRCNHPVTKNGLCNKHQNCQEFMKQFINNEEPDYEPQIWNKNYFVKGSHNCYAYFLNEKPNDALLIKCKEICNNDNSCANDKSTCRDLIPQPGDSSLITHNKLSSKSRNYTCKNMIKRIKSDNPDIKDTLLTKKCPKNYYKGTMVVDSGNTFHFYRLNKNGTWSHKPGISDISILDASDKEILVPHFADRNYKRSKTANSSINYNEFCGYFCIPKAKNKYMA